MKLEPYTNLHTLLSKQALLQPSEDRLQAVLTQSAHKAQSQVNRRAQTLWLAGIAASIAAGLFIVRMPENSQTATAQQSAPAAAKAAEADSAIELAALMADSRALESSLQNLSNSRARISQLQSLQQASAALATLDLQLDYWANTEPDNLAKQNALWRERVTVMHSVAHSEFHPTLYLVD
jgi:hypothetical protein